MEKEKQIQFNRKHPLKTLKFWYINIMLLGLMIFAVYTTNELLKNHIMLSEKVEIAIIKWILRPIIYIVGGAWILELIWILGFSISFKGWKLFNRKQHKRKKGGK